MANLAIIAAFFGCFAAVTITASLIGQVINRAADACDETDFEGYL